MSKRKHAARDESNLPGEPEIIDEYTNDELNEPRDTGLPLGDEPPFAEGVFTGGAVGESDTSEQVVRRDVDHSASAVPGWDSTGQVQCLDPVEVGTVAGNTTAAGSNVGWAAEHEAEEAGQVHTGDEILDEVLNDLGPDGAPVQEVGGEARR